MAVSADLAASSSPPRAAAAQAVAATLDRLATASPHDVERRLDALDREWDVDRTLGTQSALLGLVGVGLSAVRSRLLALPVLVAASVLAQAVTDRYPLLPLYRRLGLRTSREIARERYALKALRGDFTAIDQTQSQEEIDAAEAPVELAPSTQDRYERALAASGNGHAHDAGARGNALRALAERLPPTTTRVERQTTPGLNEAIRYRADCEVIRLGRAPQEKLAERLDALDREWDIERVLQLNAAVISLVGLALGARVHRGFLLLPAAVFTFFGQHALQGWCPPVPVLRRLGVRTRREIERERHAHKALRGDFDDVPGPYEATPTARVRAVLAAIDA